MTMERPPLTLRELAASSEVQALLTAADRALAALGYTEHGPRHAALVAAGAQNLLLRLGYPPRLAELAAIAGYLHDVGNLINRRDHGHSGALLTFELLRRFGLPLDEIAEVMIAIGNHEDDSVPLSIPGAAVILADKSDVHRSRVRNQDPRTFDIHDRVNYAVTRALVDADPVSRTITIDLLIDTTMVSILDFFEIFLGRMVQCRAAAAFLQCTLRLAINGVVMDSHPPETPLEPLLPQFE
jgi:metal-dependent HD superfamily phosphatase/phosphodiesterase